MKRRLHAIAGISAFVLIALFWISTLVSELFLAPVAVVGVKTAIVYALFALVPCLAVTGATGFAMGGKSNHPIVVGKRRRMPFIALNGLIILVPAALYLSAKAQSGDFDSVFYAVQGVELIAGVINLYLLGLNIRNGWRLSHRSVSSP